MSSSPDPLLQFEARHIGTTRQDQAEMLEAIGFKSLAELMDAAVPETIRFRGSTPLPSPISESQAIAELRALAAKNRVTRCLIGQGYYGTHTPAVIKRNVLENPSWYTAYTPYQAEISQGRLEALLNFQTMVTDLTGMKTANASMLDEGTAIAEGMLLARRSSASESDVFLVDSDVFPQTKALLEHRAAPVGIRIKYIDTASVGAGDELPDGFGICLQYPAASGAIRDITGPISAAKKKQMFVLVSSDLLALTLLVSPGSLGADAVAGTTQRFGVPMGFGGPHAGYLAVKEGLERSMPGRLIGVSVDASGKPAYRLTLQTREQHIRRDRATSNICTAQVLLAVMAAMYAVYHGPEGLRAIAGEVHRKTSALAGVLEAAGVTLEEQLFFDTLRIQSENAKEIYSRLRDRGITVLLSGSGLGVSVDETTEWHTLREIAEEFGAADPSSAAGLPRLGNLERKDAILSHPVFNSHHSETGMLRYLKRLADMDYALDRGMIPLGSCTMKLNATTEMEAVTWPEFANLHPFAPAEDAAGYHDLISQLNQWLIALTGYDAISLQPNAGSQGELAGLMAIRGYHQSRGEGHRTVCLIPSSAHGTNAASAVLAGMSVTVVACDEDGNVDLADLREKIANTGDKLAALMVTYPSTHGVYEAAIREVCELVHAAGGQVYIDGANTNAVIGYAKFGQFGGDVSHLNLHKTFCIPHGGGGPGVGPVVARAHLAPFLPGHPMATGADFPEYGPISAAPFGSASILPISWAYIRMMGENALANATANAVLSANYVARRIADAYPLLYTGNLGLIAHECIIDIRDITRDYGVTVDDIAKRLIDYGFHAPTMSFPVAGTLMIEPTESEPKAELDRFISAMLAIREEINQVGNGVWPIEDSPLRNAPHTAADLVGEWNHPYSREIAVFPHGNFAGKYWPPVKRVDAAHGDRNLVCTCPPIEAFAQ